MEATKAALAVAIVWLCNIVVTIALGWGGYLLWAGEVEGAPRIIIGLLLVAWLTRNVTIAIIDVKAREEARRW